MTVAPERPRGDLSALRIHHDEEPRRPERSWLKIIVWIVLLAALAVSALFINARFIAPSLSIPDSTTHIPSPSTCTLMPMRTRRNGLALISTRCERDWRRFLE